MKGLGRLLLNAKCFLNLSNEVLNVSAVFVGAEKHSFSFGKHLNNLFYLFHFEKHLCSQGHCGHILLDHKNQNHYASVQ